MTEQGAPRPASGPGHVSIHHVRPGETLAAIAHDHGVHLPALLRANPQIVNPNLIRPGQLVHLPKGAHAHGHAGPHGATGAGQAGRSGAPHQGPAKPGHPAAPRAPSAPGAQSAHRPARAAPANGPSPAAGVSAAGFAFIYREEHVDGISEHLHWPKGASGVTLGSGYDMRHRSRDQIVRELTGVGVPSDQAGVAAGGSHLTGEDARGFARDNHAAVTLTPDQERRLLALNMRDAVSTVAQTVKVPLTQNQHDALVSLVFNIGDPHFRSSSVLRRLNAGDYSGAADAMRMWNKSGGKVSDVLTARRAREIAMFNKPDASGPRATLPAAPARGGTPLGHAGGAGGASGGARFVDIIRRRGGGQATHDLDAGRLVIVGVRTATALNVNNGTGAYDDTMAIVHKTGVSAEVATFRCNTEPSAQYLDKPGHRPPDANRDGRPDLGQLETGQTIHYSLGTFLKHDALKISGAMARVRRDVNHDNRMDSRDPVASIAGAGGMHIHIGGPTAGPRANTWSAGCQTLPPQEHARFFATLRRWNAQQKDFYYVLVDA